MSSLAQAVRSRRESRRADRELFTALAGIGSSTARDELKLVAQRNADSRRR